MKQYWLLESKTLRRRSERFKTWNTNQNCHPSKSKIVAYQIEFVAINENLLARMLKSCESSKNQSYLTS